MRQLLALCACALLSALPATAHSVWIEPLGNQLVIRFAEPGGRLEKSPGHLDSLSAPVAFSLVTNGAVAVSVIKSTNHFALTGTSASQTAGAETGFNVMSSPGKPGRRPIFYARWQPSLAEAATPALTLDLVPTGKHGEARVWFRGQPLGSVKATLRLPDDTEREVTANAEGFIQFDTKEPGQYLLTVAHHREKLPGFYAGRTYELTSHNASLSWRQ